MRSRQYYFNKLNTCSKSQRRKWLHRLRKTTAVNSRPKGGVQRRRQQNETQYVTIYGDKQAGCWRLFDRHRFSRQEDILSVLRAMLLHKEQQQCNFLAAIRQKPGWLWGASSPSTLGGHTIEMACVLSIATDEVTIGNTSIGLSQCSSPTIPWGRVILKSIEYVEPLYPVSIPKHWSKP